MDQHMPIHYPSRTGTAEEAQGSSPRPRDSSLPARPGKFLLHHYSQEVIDV